MMWLALGLLLFHPKGNFDPQNMYKEIEKGEIEDFSPYLNQPYTYLAEGAQMYAFVSSDQSTVLKIFKASHKKPFKFGRALRHIKRTDKEWEISQNKWREKFRDTCKRYEMAFLDLKEETGLIGLHFQKTSTPIPITLKSRYTYKIDLSKVPFILQKKATLAPDYFKKYPEKAELGKNALKELFLTRTKKGFTDPRQSLRINYGFIGDKAIQIDVGKLEKYEGNISDEVAKLNKRVDDWVSAL